MNPPIPNFDPHLTAKLLRAYAARCVKLADEMESLFTPARNGTSDLFPPLARDAIRPEAIKEVIGTRSLRAGDIAKRMNTTVGALTPLLTAENGFDVRNRGWITVKETPAQ